MILKDEESASNVDSTSVSANTVVTTHHQRVVSVNNVSSTAMSSEEDESLTLMGDSAASVTLSSPLSPIAGPLLMTHRFTYANNKKRPMPVKRTSDFFRYLPKALDNFKRPISDKLMKTIIIYSDSPMSERTRSSTDNEDDEDEGVETTPSVYPSVVQMESSDMSGIGNGLQEAIKSVPSVKVTPVDHATYTAKRKVPLSRRAVINHKGWNLP